MFKRTLFRKSVWLLLALLIPAMGVFAQDAAPSLPASYQLTGFIHIPQHWNNCGPATLTMGLTYFGFPADQNPAANWLKPNSEDGNVSPWQMVDYVNKQLAGSVRALKRVGGDLTTLKTLIANNFPVIIEEGYDPEPDRLGWMGHYLLVTGYDDGSQIFTSMDSYLGPNKAISYKQVDKYWKDFNNTYIVLYKMDREPELMTLLGKDADETKNYLDALEINRQRALADPNDAFAWFNLGSNYVSLGSYDKKAFEYAAAAFDQARKIGLPWRMLWYQFTPYDAYLAVGRYQDVIDLVHTVIDVNCQDKCTAKYIEESYYYAGVAREKLGDAKRALGNYNAALQFNPNFSPARDARDRLAASSGNTDTASASGSG
jgi:hypothetical protein